MGVEIERKFLLSSPAPVREAVYCAELSQGYLSTEPVVRVRTSRRMVPRGQAAASWPLDGILQGYIAVKGNGTLVRTEYEYKVPYYEAEAMLVDLCKYVVRKVRHVIQVGSLKWEVDEFLDPLAGNWLAEVELSSEGQVYTKPDWVGQEVTQDPRYTNVALAMFGWPP